MSTREPPRLENHTSPRDLLGWAAGDAPQRCPLQDIMERVASALHSYPWTCIISLPSMMNLSLQDQKTVFYALARTIGLPSDSNRYTNQSGTYVDEVRPMTRSGVDPTVLLGECEPHADESTKPQPEDIVMLCCVRSARDGGDSLIWPTRDIRDSLLDLEHGRSFITQLERPDFYFGGLLRKPASLLQGPVLYSSDGIRYRKGAIIEGFECAGIQPSETIQDSLDALETAIQRTEPYKFRLEPGDILISLNRYGLHARTHFEDTSRLLLRVRVNSNQFSNSALDPVRVVVSE